MAAALCFFLPLSVYSKASVSKKATAATGPKVDKHEKSSEKSEENYQDLIQKAQNLTLQQDRLQTSQVLIRGIQRESRNSVGYKELIHTLGELTSVFYTEKAQALFATAESIVDVKPRDALEGYQEALKVEDKNVLILKSIARIHLRSDECEKADLRVKSIEEVDPYSPENKLLRIQVYACQKKPEQLSMLLIPGELEAVEKFSRGLQMFDAINRKDLKKAKATVSAWEAQSPDYPELHYWKWQLSKTTGTPDRIAATKYVQLCANLTPRKRKTFSIDVDLCRAKGAVELFLREKETTNSGSASSETAENIGDSR